MKKKKALKRYIALSLSVIPFTAAMADTPAETNIGTNAIVINQIQESKGLEIGNNSYARGENAIATGTNALAIGTSAVATGGNETKETIRAKLQENESKLNEIKTLTAQRNQTLQEIQDLRAREADVIEAGQRVEAARKAKEKAYEDYLAKQKNYNDTVANSKAFIDEANRKMEELNKGLAAINNIGSIDLSNPEDIKAKAMKLKEETEKIAPVGLSNEWYEGYIKNHYKALGDLRENKIIFKTLNNNHYIGQYNTSNMNYESANGRYTDLYYSFGDASISCTKSGVLSFKSDTWDLTRFISHDNIELQNLVPQKILKRYNITTDITSKDEYDKWVEETPKYKAFFKKFFMEYTTDPFMHMEDNKLANATVDNINKKLDIQQKAAEIAYYQGEYERTHNTSWLDKKQKALIEYKNLQNEFNNNYGLYQTNNNLVEIKQNLIEKWKQENITAVEEKNKVNIKTLDSELSKALAINKNALEEKQKEIDSLKDEMEQANRNYESINPNDSDIEKARKYEEIMRKLEDKSNELKAKQARLEALQQALTLHDLSQTGENAIAVGVKSLAAGKNSISMGTASVAVGENAVAIGKDSTATGTNSISLGKGSTVSGEESIAIGTGHVVTGNHSGAFGDPNTVSGDNSYAVGNNNTLKGSNSIAVGNNLIGTKNNNILIGNQLNAGVYGRNAIIIGSNDALKETLEEHELPADTILRTVKPLSGTDKILLGNNNLSVGNYNIVLGSENVTVGKNNYIIGRYNKILKNESMIPSNMQGLEFEPLMLDTLTSGTQNNIVIGDNNSLEEKTSMVLLGSNIKIKPKSKDPEVLEIIGIYNSVALGNNSEINTSYEVSVGAPERERYITHVKDGYITATSTDAVTGRQLYKVQKQLDTINPSTYVTYDKANDSVTLQKMEEKPWVTLKIKSGSINGSAYLEKRVYLTEDNKLPKIIGQGHLDNGDHIPETDSIFDLELKETKNFDKNKVYASGEEVEVAIPLVNDKNSDNTTTSSFGPYYVHNKLGLKYADTNELLDEMAAPLKYRPKEGAIRMTNLADGEISATSTDAITGKQLHAIKIELDKKPNASYFNGALDSKVDRDELYNYVKYDDDTNSITLTKSVFTHPKDRFPSPIDSTIVIHNLGDGEISATSTDAINGKQIHALKTSMANKDLAGLSETGKTEIRTLAKESVKVVNGTNTTVTTGTDGNATTYAVNVSDDTIKNLAKQAVDISGKADKTELANKVDTSTFNTEMAKKANTDASNIDTAKWIEKLGTGKNATGNTGLVTGDTLNKAIASVDVSSQITGKANTDLDNLTETGKTAVRTLAKEGVKVIDGTNTTVTTGTDGNATTYAVNVSDDTIKNLAKQAVDISGKADKTELANKVDTSTFNTEMAKKANTDASNIDTAKWIEKLGTGKNVAGNTGLVTGDTLNKAISSIDVSNQITNKASTDLDNLTDTGKTEIRTLAKESVKVINGTNTTVTTGTDGNATTYAVNVSDDTIKNLAKQAVDISGKADKTELANKVDTSTLNTELAKKANTNASNLTASDIEAWTKALGATSVASGEKGLVSGDTVFKYVKENLPKASDLMRTDGVTTFIDDTGSSQVLDISHDTDEGRSGRVLTGVITDASNPYSAASTSYVQSVTRDLESRMHDSQRKASAKSIAIAGLHPLPYDEDNKLNIAISQGRYEGAGATAIGLFYQPTPDMSFNVASTISDGSKAFQFGASFRIGKGSSERRKATSAEMNALKKEMEAIKARDAALEKELNALKEAVALMTGVKTTRKENVTPFPDIPEGHWAKDAVENLHQNNIVEGYPDGTFKGDKTMTRYEYAKMLYETKAHA